jgi:hypothetical protein
VASFIRKVPTGSGARAVQIVHKQDRRVVGIEHIGSAHDEAQLAVLMEIAGQQLHAGQESLNVGFATPAASSSPTSSPTPSASGSGPRVAGVRSQLLWDILAGAYADLAFDAVGDEAFKSLVLGRIVEPISKADTLRVLSEIGVPRPWLRTVFGLWSGASSGTAAAHAPGRAWRTRRARPQAGRGWCSTTARHCTSRPRTRTSSLRSG